MDPLHLFLGHKSQTPEELIKSLRACRGYDETRKGNMGSLMEVIAFLTRLIYDRGIYTMVEGGEVQKNELGTMDADVKADLTNALRSATERLSEILTDKQLWA